MLFNESIVLIKGISNLVPWLFHCKIKGNIMKSPVFNLLYSKYLFKKNRFKLRITLVLSSLSLYSFFYLILTSLKSRKAAFSRKKSRNRNFMFHQAFPSCEINMLFHSAQYSIYDHIIIFNF